MIPSAGGTCRSDAFRVPGLSWLCLLWRGAVRDLLTLPEHVYLGTPVSCHGRRSVCLSGGQETQETNDVNSVPLECAPAQALPGAPLSSHC